jgi:hypothetical protein
VKREYTATVTKGGTLIFELPALEEEGRLSLRSKEITVSYKTTRKPRKYLQYGYYFGVVVAYIHYTFTELGYNVTPEGVHEMLKARFNNIQVVCEKTGEIITVSDTTTELETWEFARMIEMIRQWFLESFGVPIPEPNRDKLAQQMAQEELEKTIAEKKNGNT